MPPIVPLLLIHGGAGDIADSSVKGKFKGMKAAIRLALPFLCPTSGKGNALNAVEHAVRSMELDKSFNAGYGACLNTDGNVEVEASIMDGAHLKAGCVSLLHDIMHPISVAKCVLEKSVHTFLGGQHAQQFALDNGFKQLENGALVTDSARAALANFLKDRAAGKDTTFALTELETLKTDPAGETVGAVAIDAIGNIAVATSTGGITGKAPGRIGDTPLLGCGTYADNELGGVSTTGHGETLMRYNLAQRIVQSMKDGQKTAQEATESECTAMTKRLNGTGGAITIDVNGNPGIYFTSKRMAWAYVKNDKIYYGIDKDVVFEEPL